MSPAGSPVPADGLNAAARPTKPDHDAIVDDGPDEAGAKGPSQSPLLSAQVTGSD